MDKGASEGAETPQEQLKPHRISVVVAAVRPNTATTWEMLGEHKVEMMLDSGSSISLIQESTAATFSTEYNTMSFRLKLVSASGGNIPVLGCMTLLLCIGEVQCTSHPPFSSSPISYCSRHIGLRFPLKVLDFTSNPIKISSQPTKSDNSDNTKTVLDIAKQITNKVCVVNVLIETAEDTVDNYCAIPLFGKRSLQYDVPLCNVSALAPLFCQCKKLSRTCLGSTTVAEHFFPTTGTPVKVPPW